jgi:uncharacterized membrane-anchored protein YitT (DUF2179 family)
MKKLLYIFIGCLLTSLGIVILKDSHIVTGGTAGLSLSLSYLTNLPFSILFFVVNLPFYIFSIIRMGWRFTLSTVGSVTLLSLLAALEQWIPAISIPMLVGSIFGGFIIGIGVTMVFLNGSSLGGANILALFLQKRFNINPGKVNFLFDLTVVLSSIYTVGATKGIFSIISIAVTSKVISYFKNQIASQNVTKVEKEASRFPEALPVAVGE